MSNTHAQAPAPWGEEITPLTEVCGGQYVLLHELARGDLSIVYRAKPAGSRDSIAFKVIQSRCIGDEVLVRRFRREAELLKKIEHPNVVRLIDHGTIEDGRDFIALELLVGSTLAEAEAKTPRMSPERTCRIARQVARALRTMHMAGIIHRDLEPENILLIGPENAERVKLVDFGEAGDVGAPARRVKVTDEESSGRPVDEPSYRAPEQLRQRPPDPSMDVFALGVIMYEMLAGEHPFYSPPAEASSRPGPLTIRSKVFDAPEELLGLVADCIEEEPSERPSSMDEVVQRIDKALLWMGVVPHEISANADEDARTQLWAAADPGKVSEESRPRAGGEPESKWRARERPAPAPSRATPDREEATDESSSSRGRPLGDRDSTPDPEQDFGSVREPTGPERQSDQDEPTTGSSPRIDLDDLEGGQTLDDTPFVVDTVAWTKPVPAAKKNEPAGKGRPRVQARPMGNKGKPSGRHAPTSSAREPRRERGSDSEPRREQVRRPKTTAARPPVPPPLPRWLLPLGLFIIVMLAYGVWMVWTA